MKILNINSYYYSSTVYRNLQYTLIKKKLNSLTYVPLARDYIPRNECQYVREDNVIMSKCYNEVDRYLFYIKHGKILKNIKEVLGNKNFDLLHAHSLFSNGYIAYKLKQKYNIPYVVAVRSTDINLFFHKVFYLRKTGINILKGAYKIIFLSEPYKKNTIEKYVPGKYKKEIEGKSIVIPNGINKFWLENKYKERSNPKKNRIRLVYAGQISSNKNIETTIKACELFISQGYEINFKVIGKIMHGRYNDLIKKHSFIQYITYCPKEELINHYRNSDIFIMPSKHETFGLVYPEAMSQGLPVIYTRGQGFDGHFEEGEIGYPVQYDSPDEIVQRIEDILNNYQTISKNCIKKVDKFDWDKIVNEYIAIYKTYIK